MSGRIINTDADVAEGLAFLTGIEPRFAKVAPQVVPLPLRRKPEGFGQLVSAIVGQQVSTASAATIWKRVQDANFDQVEQVRAATEDDLRSVGLSRPKVRYVRALAEADIDYDALRTLSDADVIKTLVAVTGIGLWTAEIYAKFSLGRADVIAAGDLAIQIAAQDLFELEDRPTDAELRAMAVRWSPWRSVAARLLWAYYRERKQRDGIR